MRRTTFPLAAGVIAYSALACGIGGPSFEVTPAKLDGACSVPFDYCTRARCSVKNLGSSAAPATVGFKLTRPDGTVVLAEEYVMLDPKETKEVHHDFTEAKLADRDQSNVECSASAAK